MKQHCITIVAYFIVTLLSNAQQISLGYQFSTLECSGGLYASGDNTNGQLGIGNTNSTNYYGIVQGIPNVTEISSGLFHTLVLDASGDVYAFGLNSAGSLGNGSIIGSNTPIQTLNPSGNSTLANIIDIDCSDSYASLAVDNTGHVLEWGYINSNSVLLPQYVFKNQNALLNNIIKVASGVYSRYALDNNGNVWSWGENNNGSLGQGQMGGPDLIYAQQIQGLNNIVQISSGLSHLIALDSNGNVWTVGRNNRGQLGNGSQNNSSVPVMVLNPFGSGVLKDIKSIEAGLSNCFAISVSGKAYAWGENAYGALGVGFSSLRVLLPTLIVGIDGVGTLIDIEYISSNGEATVAKTDQLCNVVGWGLTTSGLLGQFSQNTTGIPRSIDLSSISCCSPLGGGGTFANFEASETVICPGKCVRVEAIVASGNPTIENWFVMGGIANITNTSGLITEMCFDNPGNYRVWAQANGESFPLMDLIHITVLPEDSRKCKFETNNSDVNMNRLTKTDIVTDIKIFPNPSSSVFNVQLNDVSVTSYEVKDIYGKRIQAASLNSNELFKIDLAQQTKGIYFLLLHTDSGYNTFKLIKK